jgi:predicted metalloprotease with PDZ domain
MILRKPLFNYQSIDKRRQARRIDVSRHRIMLAAALLLVCSGTARAEALTARISVLSTAPARVRIEGERNLPTRAWSFRNIYAGVMNLGERIENLTLADRSGTGVPVRKLAPGEYEAATDATRFSYEMRLDAPMRDTDAAHVSWLTNEGGFLMLGDLLPLPVNRKEAAAEANATVSFTLPQTWTIAASADAGGGGQFAAADAERAVFFVGQQLREKRQRVSALEFAFVTRGDWAFSDEEAASLAASILKDHAETFNGAPQGRVMLALSQFPRAASAADRWSAETRGQTVMFLSGKAPSARVALAQLSFPLAHELFHLWIPNALALDGNYDWFYEGFTLYQALRTAVRLELLTFQDYLNALGRAFDAYKSAEGREKMSLLEASERRWTLSPTLVYNKGMLVAFLYDLSLRHKTRGKRSLDDAYRELFRLHKSSSARKDGNLAALAALNSAGEMKELTRHYIEGAGAIALAEALAPFGLKVEAGSVRTRIAAADTLSGAQRDLLRKFGYNEKLDGTHRRRAPARK